MAAAGISVYQNFWSNIYNFNPSDKSWSLLPADATCIAALGPLPDFPELEGVANLLAGGCSPPLCARTWQGGSGSTLNFES
jgi:protein XRP2